MTNKLYLTMRNERGHVKTYNPAALPAEAPAEVRLAAAKLGYVQPAQAPAEVAGKRGRGRPKGYVCRPETVAQMVAKRQATMAARKASIEQHFGA